MSWFRHKQAGPIGLDIGCDRLRMLQRQDCQGRVQIRAAAQERFGPEAHRAVGTGFLRLHNSRRIINRLLDTHPFKGNQVVTCLKADQLHRDQITVPVEATDAQRQVLARRRLGWSDQEGCIWFYPAGRIVSGSRPQSRFWIYAASEETLLRQRLDLADMGLDGIDLEIPVGVLWNARRVDGRPEFRDQLQLLVDGGRRFATMALIHRDTLVWAQSCERIESAFDGRLAACIEEGLDSAPRTIGNCPLSLFCLGGGTIAAEQRQWLEDRLGRRLQQRGSLTERIRQADSNHCLERAPCSEWITAWMLSGSTVRRRRLSVPA